MNPSLASDYQHATRHPRAARVSAEAAEAGTKLEGRRTPGRTNARGMRKARAAARGAHTTYVRTTYSSSARHLYAANAFI